MPEFSKTQLLIVAIVAFVVFLFSLEIKTFGGYTIFILLIVAIIYFFLGSYLLQALQTRQSYFTIALLIFALFLISALAYGLNAVLENKKQIDSQWNEYRCKPYILPFAGTLIGPSNITPTGNFAQCLWEVNQNFFNILISPFTKMIQLIVGILTGLVADVQNLRKIVAYLRSSVKEITKDVYQRLYDTYARVAFIIKKIMRIFYQLFVVFEDLFNVMLYAFYSLASIWNGPIGGMSRGIGKIGKFFCFDGDTPVKTKFDGIIPIKKLCAGDLLSNDEEVITIMKLSSYGIKMYNLDGILVAGDHLVFNNNTQKWMRVSEMSNAKQVEDYMEQYIYCLNTSDARIQIGNYIFADYQETDNKLINVAIYKLVLEYLNDINHVNSNEFNINSITDNDIFHYSEWGFHENTMIKMKNGNLKSISKLKIGEETLRGGKVIGLVIMLADETLLYQYGMNLVSGSAIVYESRKWKPVYQSSQGKICFTNNCECEYLYNVITEYNQIETVDGIVFTDYQQINNLRLNKKIDIFIENFLNQ